jgi:YesN/AraC family two-component response regulator
MIIDNQAVICARTGKALDEFIELVYSVQDSQKISQLKPCIDYISKNYDKPIALTDVAKVAHLSVSRLAHIFKEQTGITIIDYLTKVRIEKAKQLLMFTDKNCTEVCFDVGYNNQSYFTRTFKELTSMTPKQFKKSNQRK